MTIGERVKHIRTSPQIALSLEKFGARLGVQRSAMSKIENGHVSLTDQMIIAICREFNVSEAWLRTGEGEPFIESSRDEAIEALCQDALRDEDDSFRRRFIAALSALDVSDWEVLEKFVDLIERNKKEKPLETDRDRIIRELDRELQEEERLEEESGASTAG